MIMIPIIAEKIATSPIGSLSVQLMKHPALGLVKLIACSYVEVVNGRVTANMA
jgi:hypothetical protein